jgi:hypothetical protein
VAFVTFGRKAMGRLIGGVAAGLVAAMLVVTAVEAIAHGLFPAPPGADLATAEGLRAAMAQVPAGLKILVLGGWTLGTLAGAWIADRIGRRGLAGYLVAALVAAAGVWTMAEIPHPAWMQAGGLLLPFAAAFLAERLAHRRF